MKIVIFGATGTVGRLLIKGALAQNHSVTAFARRPEALNMTDQNLAVFKGDVLDRAAVREAIKGQDSVICALGMPILNADQLRARGTSNIVAAMEAEGVKRIICLSSFGVGDSWAELPARYKYLIAPILMRRLFADHGAQEKHLQASMLDWVLVRPGGFTKDRAGVEVLHGVRAAGRSLKAAISPQSVSKFILNQLADNTYLHKAPFLSY